MIFSRRALSTHKADVFEVCINSIPSALPTLNPLFFTRSVVRRGRVQGPGAICHEGLARQALHAVRERSVPHHSRAARPAASRCQQRAACGDWYGSQAANAAAGATADGHGHDHAGPSRAVQPAPAAAEQVNRVGFRRYHYGEQQGHPRVGR